IITSSAAVVDDRVYFAAGKTVYSLNARNGRLRWRTVICGNPDRPGCATDAAVESPGGISPPGAPRTVHDPLESHGSRCSAVALNGFALPTGSSRFQLASGQGRTTQPLRSSPITRPSTLLRAAPPLRLASVLSPSRLEPLAACPFPPRRVTKHRFSRSLRN